MQEDVKAKVFGQLYVVVFSNGTVKAGMSEGNAKQRISSHKNAGQAFCIEMYEHYFTDIYTNDLRERENKMLKVLENTAKRTSGREWFMFNSKIDAANFCSKYINQEGTDSFNERPSEQEIIKLKTESKEIADSVFERFSSKAKSEDTYVGPKNMILYIASLVIAAHDIVSYNTTRDDDPTPELTKAIFDCYDEFSSKCGKKSDTAWTSDAVEAAKAGYDVCRQLTIEHAYKIIFAAKDYEEVTEQFNELLSSK